MKCHILFSGKIKKTFTNLLSAELAQRVANMVTIEIYDWLAADITLHWAFLDLCHSYF